MSAADKRARAEARRAEIAAIEPFTDLQVGVSCAFDPASGEYVIGLMLGVDSGPDLTSLVIGQPPRRRDAFPVLELARVPHRAIADRLRQLYGAGVSAAAAPPAEDPT